MGNVGPNYDDLDLLHALSLRERGNWDDNVKGGENTNMMSRSISLPVAHSSRNSQDNTNNNSQNNSNYQTQNNSSNNSNHESRVHSRVSSGRKRDRDTPLDDMTDDDFVSESD